MGPMFSGKSSLLQARIRRFQTMKWDTLVLTSCLDTRHTKGIHEVHALTTHDGISVPALAVNQLMPVIMLESYQNAKAIVLEEAQFFSDLLEFVLHAVEIDCKNVIVAGLDGDRNRCQFGQILDLIPYSDTVTKLNSLCLRCGDGSPGVFSCLVAEDEERQQIRVGGDEIYEAMCRKHYLEYKRNNSKLC
eukprot:CRZ01473.1 hypothetical protein [Spongospora subterranea]